MAKRRRKGKLQPVGGVIGGVLGDLGLGQAQRAFEIAECWSEAVGAEVARHAKPVALRAGVLEVSVESSVWAQELQARQPEILAALAGVLEGEAPTGLHFRVG